MALVPDVIGGRKAPQREQCDWAQHAMAAGFAALLSVAAYLLQGHIGLGLSDEGFLWYGVQRVLAGEVPIRDFGAYDPGRYYFAAALLGIAGESGIIALRVVSYIVQAIGIYAAMILVAGSSRWSSRTARAGLMLVTGTVLACWMFELYKQYDKLTAILLVTTLAYLLERPTRQRYFVFGVVVGLAAVIGRNHGVYGALGGVLAMAYLAIERVDGRLCFRPSAGPLYWAGGLLAGFSPMLLMAALAPGFLPAFLANLKLMLEMGATNLALPVPWPWLFPLTELPFNDALGLFAEGATFVALPAFCAGGLGYLIYSGATGRRAVPALAAAILIAPGYAHYAFSRADLYHLATGALPMLLAMLVLLGQLRQRVVAAASAALLLAATVRLTYGYHPVEKECGDRANGAIKRPACVKLTVGKDTLLLRPLSARFIQDLGRMVARIPADREILVLPWLSGAYPIFGKRSPTWDIYAMFPRSEAFQKEEIERIRRARPGMIFIANGAVDGRADLTFSSTNPLIFQHVVENYQVVSRLGSSYLFVPPELAAAFGK